MNKDSKIFIAGANGLVGKALTAELQTAGYTNLLTPTRAQLDLEDPRATEWYFSVHEPDYVFFCAAMVGGIAHNIAKKVDFLSRNLAIELNVLQNAAKYGVEKLIFVATSCCYPRDCEQPIKETSLWTGPLEPTTEAYSVAKLAGIKLCQYYREEWDADFVSVFPCNIYGPHDNFDPNTAHCLPGMLARMHHAKVEGNPFFTVWGTGDARREFLYSHDLAKALILVANRPAGGELLFNIGSELELCIRDLAYTIKGLIQYPGKLFFDPTKPEGTSRKLLDSSKIRSLGWEPEMLIGAGIGRTYRHFLCQRCDG